MLIEPLVIEGAWLVTPTKHGDPRGLFLEWFREARFAEVTGHGFRMAQANCSVSGRGVVRGIHFADVPPGQAKYVTCVAGELLDVVVDVRVGSPTFGRWTSVLLNSQNRCAVHVSEGLGHGFAARSDNTTAIYLCSEPYNPVAEHQVNPADPMIGINWGMPPSEILLSAKDLEAPLLADALDSGLLPTWAACRNYREKSSAT